MSQHAAEVYGITDVCSYVSTGGLKCIVFELLMLPYLSFVSLSIHHIGGVGVRGETWCARSTLLFVLVDE